MLGKWRTTIPPGTAKQGGTGDPKSEGVQSVFFFFLILLYNYRITAVWDWRQGLARGIRYSENNNYISSIE